MSVPAPRLLFWETTKACNLRCRHCRAVPTDEPGPGELTAEEGRRLVDEAADLGVRIFVFSGGEPLLRPDLFELIERARARGMEAAVATNGTKLTAEIAAAFRRLGVARVSVSFDGPDAATHDGFRGIPGAFDAARAGLAHLRLAGQPFQINTTVTRENMDHLVEMVDMAEREGAAALHFFFLVPVGCGAEIPPHQRITPDEYERLLGWFADECDRRTLEMRATCAPHLQRIVAQRRGAARAAGQAAGAAPAAAPGHPGGHPGGAHVTRGCLAGSGIVFVGCDGTLQPCGYMPLVVGSIRDASLTSIWQGSRVLADLRDPGSLTGSCGRCAFRFRCGGCRARALAASGDALGDEPMCVWGEGLDGARPDEG